ncbi:unnamed protein product, partial [Meganyctiphanes norvegica]
MGLLWRLTRRKAVTLENSKLQRVLTTLDLTLLGIGSTLGVGIYVLAGQVSKSIAGPAVIISFLIAGIASIFAGLCYAEFGARVPKAGSAYIYSYVCVGEFVAFIIGWNLILEYVIGTASVARGLSGYVDELANGTISEAFISAMPMDVPALADYPDFLAFGFCAALTVILSLGVKESSRLSGIFTLINLIVVTYVIITAGTEAEGQNWALNSTDVEETCTEVPPPGRDWGSGGFAPYGFSGIMQGAATCFYGFIGFDVIATTGEEAINPARSIPISITLSLLAVFISYFSMSCVLTLALPYCLQDEKASLIHLFQYFYDITGVEFWNVSKWIISVGAIFGFSASLFGAMFPMPRIIYAMANDGLLFKPLAIINSRFQTPIYATLVTGLFAGVMALVFDLEALVDMMSIGTLLAYTVVDICLMLLRYEEDEENIRKGIDKEEFTISDYMKQLFNTKNVKDSCRLTASLTSYATISFCLICFVLALLLVVLQKELAQAEVGALVGVSVVAVLTLINIIIIARQPESKKKLDFKVPLVPWVPALSAFINLYLMCNLDSATWIRFAVWMTIGFIVYFGYGIRKSTEELQRTSSVPITSVDKENFKSDKVNGRGCLYVQMCKLKPSVLADNILNEVRLGSHAAQGRLQLVVTLVKVKQEDILHQKLPAIKKAPNTKFTAAPSRLGKMIIRHEALKIAKALQIMGFKASNGFCTRFMKRNENTSTDMVPDGSRSLFNAHLTVEVTEVLKEVNTDVALDYVTKCCISPPRIRGYQMQWMARKMTCCGIYEIETADSNEGDDP